MPTDALYISFERLAPDPWLFGAGDVAAWSEWYDSQHLADVCRALGAYAATRWKVTSPGAAEYAAMYEIEGSDWVRGLDKLRQELPNWWAAGRMHPLQKTLQSVLVRTIAEYDPATGHLYRKRPQPGASQRMSSTTKALSLVFSAPNDPAQEESWNEWYMHTHSPEAIKTGAYTRASRYERVLPQPSGGNMEVFFTHLTIYDIERDEKLPPIDWPTVGRGWAAKGLMHPNHTGSPGFHLKPTGKWTGVGFHPQGAN